MDDNIKKLLYSVQNAQMSIDEAYSYLKELPYQDIGHTKIDHHRMMRTGAPEVIFGHGKTTPQILEIAKKIIERNHNLLVTRIDADVYDELKQMDQAIEYNALARCAFKEVNPLPLTDGMVAVVCAGTSDLPIVEEACTTLKILGNRFEKVTDVGVAGIHRLLDKKRILDEANVVIVCAGMEGALASVVGGLVDKVVIAVPTSIGYGASMGGLSALLTMLNSCVPSVVVVNIDNGFGAAYSASMINRRMSAK